MHMLFSLQFRQSGSLGLQTKAPNSIKASTKSEFLFNLNKFFLFISTRLLKFILFSFLFNNLEKTLLTFPSIARVGSLKIKACRAFAVYSPIPGNLIISSYSLGN